jgi:hypothetical protein
LKKKARENSKLVKVREESKEGKEKNTDYLDLSNTFLAK